MSDRKELFCEGTMLEQAKKALIGLAGRPVLAAVSGGMDSMCLLHLLTTWGREQGIAVTAAHFHHGLRPETADRDEAFVRDWCAESGVPFVCGRGDVRALAEREKLSLEEAARDARYAFLRQTAGEMPILTAHHADDSAETMLLNLLRGTGLRGLTGIPSAEDGLLRPFRDIPRQTLEEYARENTIPWVEDETNALDDAARNVLRHRVLPVLRELNPGAVENMARTAELLRRDEAVLCRETEKLLSACRPVGDGFVLPLAEARAAEPAILGRCLLELLGRTAGHRKDIAFAHVEAVRSLLESTPGREAHLPCGVVARRATDGVTVFRSGDTPEAATIRPGDAVRFGAWKVMLTRSPGGQKLYLPAGAVLTVTAWDRGDRMCLPDSRGERSLKRLCVDAGILPEQRDRMPVLRVDGRCAAVPDIGVDRGYLSEPCGEPVYVIFIKETEENHHGA